MFDFDECIFYPDIINEIIFFQFGMIGYGKKQQSQASVLTEDTLVYAPKQRPLQPSEELPQLELGVSDYVERNSTASLTIKRRNSANECFSILGFLNRRVKGSRDRLFSQDLMGQEGSRWNPNGGKF